MIITRKIQVFVCEDDKNLRKEYYEKLYNNRNVAVKVANMAVSHEFALDHKKTLGTRLLDFGLISTKNCFFLP